MKTSSPKAQERANKKSTNAKARNARRKAVQKEATIEKTMVQAKAKKSAQEKAALKPETKLPSLKFMGVRVHHNDMNKNNATRHVDFAFDRDGFLDGHLTVRRSQLAKTGEIIPLLLDSGYSGSNTATLKNELLLCLEESAKAKISSYTHQQGWHDNTYIFGDENLPQKVKFIKSDSINYEEFHRSGSIESWKEYAKYGIFSSRFRFALGLGFACVIMKDMGIPSFGILLKGPTSSGKTFFEMVAASIHGKIVENGIPTLSSTSVGLQDLANGANDGLLAIDEIGSRDSANGDLYNFLRTFTYTALNGNRRVRSAKNQKDNNIRVDGSRFIFFTAGEFTLSDRKSGEAVRLMQLDIIPQGFTSFLDIKNPDKKYGETIRAKSEKITELKRLFSQNQGYPLIEFVQKYQADAKRIEKINAYKSQFMVHVTSIANTAQKQRMAEFISSVYVGAALAIDYKILVGFNKKTTLDNIASCFANIIANAELDLMKASTVDVSASMPQFIEMVKSLNIVKINDGETMSSKKIAQSDGFLQFRPRSRDVKRRTLVIADSIKSKMSDSNLRSQIMDKLQKDGILINCQANSYTAQVVVKELGNGKNNFYVFDTKKLNAMLQ